MNRDEATRIVEQRHARRLHIEPTQASVQPAFFTLVGLSGMTVLGIGFIPWWGTMLAAALVGASIFLHTKQKNEQMRGEVLRLMQQAE